MKKDLSTCNILWPRGYRIKSTCCLIDFKGLVWYILCFPPLSEVGSMFQFTVTVFHSLGCLAMLPGVFLDFVFISCKFFCCFLALKGETNVCTCLCRKKEKILFMHIFLEVFLLSLKAIEIDSWEESLQIRKLLFKMEFLTSICNSFLVITISLKFLHFCILLLCSCAECWQADWHNCLLRH